MAAESFATSFYEFNQALCSSRPVFTAKTVNLVDTQSIAFLIEQTLGTNSGQLIPYVSPSFFEYPLVNPNTRIAACVQTGNVVGTSFLNTSLPIALAGYAVLSQVAFLGKAPINPLTNQKVSDGDFVIVWPEESTDCTLVGFDVTIAPSLTGTIGTSVSAGSAQLPGISVSRPGNASFTRVPITLSNYKDGSSSVSIVAHYQVPETSTLIVVPK